MLHRIIRPISFFQVSRVLLSIKFWLSDQTWHSHFSKGLFQNCDLFSSMKQQKLAELIYKHHLKCLAWHAGVGAAIQFSSFVDRRLLWAVQWNKQKNWKNVPTSKVRESWVSYQTHTSMLQKILIMYLTFGVWWLLKRYPASKFLNPSILGILSNKCQYVYRIIRPISSFQVS